LAFDFSEECRLNQVDEGFVKRIDAKLFPLLEKAVRIDPNFNKFLSEGIAEFDKTTLSNFETFEAMINRIGVQLSPKEMATTFMIEYLVITESVLTYMVDVIVFALLSTGKNLKDPKQKDPNNTKYVCLPEEIRLIPLGDKLGFLSANGFSMFSKRCSVQIRNSSAHLNYSVDSSGNISLPNGKKIKFVDGMNEHHDKIREGALGGFIAFRHFYYENYGKYIP
jgi:hypothetical protein